MIKSRHWNWRGDSPADRLRVFSLSWILFPLLFFSFSGSKLPGYILPIVPAIALLGGERLARIVNSRRDSWTMRIVASLLIAYGLGGIAYGFTSGLLTHACILLVVAPLILAGVTSLLFEREKRATALIMLLAIPLSFAIALNCGVPRLSQSYSSKNLIAKADQRGYGTAPVLALHEIDRTAEFYAAGRLVYKSDGEPLRLEGAAQALEAARLRNTAVLILVPVKYLDQLTQLKSGSIEVIADNGVMAIVAVRPASG
jgi:4-amino-4-deoxy-L-arabinose transferase-like glycosyltransferase